MKRNYLNQLTSLILVSLIAVSLLLSCKKDKLTDSNETYTENESYTESNSEAVVKRIKTFESQLEAVRSGAQRQESYIDIDSAVWNIEALFNSTFSMPDGNYIEKKTQELTFDIKVHRNNKFSMNDVNVLYEDIIESVRDAYINDGFEDDKGIMYIIVDNANSDTRAAQLKVTLVSGRTNTKPKTYIETIVAGPFDFSGCWYYGEYGGTCDDPFVMIDAAELLEDTVNYFYGSDASSLKSSNNRNIYVDLAVISLNGNEYPYNGVYNLFYKKNCAKEDLYLTGADLNGYYFEERNVIFGKVPKDPRFKSMLPENPTFIEIDITGVCSMEGDDVIYNHQHNILYGTKCEVSKNVMGNTKNIIDYKY